jgi:hypothetical protein
MSFQHQGAACGLLCDLLAPNLFLFRVVPCFVATRLKLNLDDQSAVSIQKAFQRALFLRFDTAPLILGCIFLLLLHLR